MGDLNREPKNSPDETSSRNVRARLWVRYLGIILVTGLVLALTLNAAFAWGYVWFLLHPACATKNEENPQNTVEIWLDPSQDTRIRAWYYPPGNGVVIVSLGGLYGSLGDQLPPVNFLLDAGYGVLQIDSRACGLPPRAVTLGAAEVDDVGAALAYLRSQPDVREVGIFGFSMGGAAAIRAAARYPELAGVVAEGGYYNLGDDFVEPDSKETPARRMFLYLIAWSYWLQSGYDPWLVSPIDDIPKISPRQVLLIYGEHEALSGRAQAQFAAANEPKAIWIVPGGEHGRNHLVEPDAYSEHILGFFDQVFNK